MWSIETSFEMYKQWMAACRIYVASGIAAGLWIWPTVAMRRRLWTFRLQIERQSGNFPVRRRIAHIPHRADGWAQTQSGCLDVGDSVGHYEGPELVIDVTGFNDEQSWLDSAGHPHSDQLHLLERYRRLNANTMRYTVTIEDPKAYTRPWSTSYIYRVNPGTEIMEYWCTENEKTRKIWVGK
jgi:hypothetical protein